MPNPRRYTDPKPGEPISLVFTATGVGRYRTVLDYALQGQKRKQRRQTFATLTEARAHVAEVKALRKLGSLPNRDKKTFAVFMSEYLEDCEARVRSITLRTYRSALKPYVQALGSREMGHISVRDIEGVVRAQQELGRSRRTIGLGLSQTRAVFARAMRDGVVMRNVADGVAAVGRPPKPRTALSLEEFRQVSNYASQHRMAAAWVLTLFGLRRSEVVGLKWRDIDFSCQPAQLTIRAGRTENTVHLTPPKTLKGFRTLPLTEDLEQALRRWRASMINEFGIAIVSHDRFVFLNAQGNPVRPEWMSDEWKRLCVGAGISRNIVLHEARHTSVTMMRSSGVPDRIVAAWHGHDESTMRTTYDHANQDHTGLLSAATTLSALQSRSA